jgi:transcription initiation factor TFIIH subunit 2
MAGTATEPTAMLGLDVDPERGYAWEGSFSRTWEALQEDAGGSLSAVVEEMAASNSLAVQRRKGLLKALLGATGGATTAIKRGLLRHLVLVLDLSASLREKDMFPTRIECMCEEVERFVEGFFEVNPLSHLGLVGTRDGLAFVLAPITSSPSSLVQALREQKATGVDGCSGEPSLGNALDLVHSLLR